MEDRHALGVTGKMEETATHNAQADKAEVTRFSTITGNLSPCRIFTISHPSSADLNSS
jgi:hypothetical protein